MKNTLIRIHSLNNNGIFDTMFNEEIVIKENSSIALQQLSFNRAESQLIINGENDTITFQVEDATGANDQDGDAIGGSHTIRLTHKKYTREDLDELLQEISDEMNKKLNSYADSENGTNIRCSLNDQVRVEIEFKRTILHYVAPQLPDGAGADPSYKQGATMGAGVATVGDDFNYIYSSTAPSNTDIGTQWFADGIPFTRGCGSFRTQIHTFNNADAAVPSGFGIGLLDTSLTYKLNDGTLAEADLSYRLSVKGVSGTATYAAHPVTSATVVCATQTNAAPDNNDIMEICLEKGKVRMRVHRDASATYDLIGESDYLYASDDNFEEQPNYLVVGYVFGTATKSSINRVTYQADPYESGNPIVNTKKLTAVGRGKLITINTNVGNPPTPSNEAVSPFNVIFSSFNLARNLGFLTLDLNPDLEDRDNLTEPFVGERAITKFLGTDTFMLELLNIPVNSYDSYSPRYSQNPNAMMGGRQNILGAVVVSELAPSPEDHVYHEPSNLLFLKMNNPTPLSLRRIRARIISNDYSPVTIQGLAEVALIIQEEC